MVEEVLPNLYKIVLPLPRNPLKAINSYVIEADGRFLIVDTGMNREECRSVLFAGLKELNVDLSRTDIFVTHMHADHSGLAATLATNTSKIYFNHADAMAVLKANNNLSEHWQRRADFARRNGFPADKLEQAILNHPGHRYRLQGSFDFCDVKDGDEIGIGEYLFKCIATPGHTSGHVCLYEPNQKIFMSGDHILSDITPNIQLWGSGRDALKEYLTSLDKVYDLDVSLVLPGHRVAFKTFKERIKELKHHHEIRANEILSILNKKDEQNAFQVASQMTWDFKCESFELFPVSQKWFATGEALSHLKYLEEKGKIRRVAQDSNIVFSLVAS